MLEESLLGPGAIRSNLEGTAAGGPTPSADVVLSTPGNPATSQSEELLPADAAGAVRTTRHDPGHAPIEPIGYGVLGAAVIVLVDRMRRAQMRRRPVGLRVTLPDDDLRALESGLRVGADVRQLLDIQGALRLLWTRTARDASTPPPMIAARCSSDHVEFVLDPRGVGLVVPPPFTATADGVVWRVPTTVLREEQSQRVGAMREEGSALPTLVTLGADDESTLLVDLEQAGSVSVSGGDASMMLQGAVVELCTAPWSAGVDVVVIGHRGDLAGLERARQAPSVAAVVPEVRRRAGSQRVLAVDAGVTRVSDARWNSLDPCWDPLVVVCFADAVKAEPEAVAALVDLAGDGSTGIALLAGGAVDDARWSVVSDGQVMDLRGPAYSGCREASPGEGPRVDAPIGSQGLRPQPAPPDLLTKVDALLTAADGALPFEAPVEPVTAMEGLSSTRDHGSTPGEVRVLVLGPVAVEGAARPFSRAWSLDLVVYLTMHRDGATSGRWTSALWPDRIPAPATVHSTASSARRALGVSSIGEDHLPRAHGRLKLGPSVTSDWEDFLRLSKSEDPDDWERALSLVRGRPFDGLRASDWLVLEGTMATVEATVVDVACRYARICLDAGPAGATKAEWSARKALLVSQYDERLYRTLMAASDIAGNPAGIERTMSELLSLVAEEVEPFDAVHPETWALYKTLSRRPATRRQADA